MQIDKWNPLENEMFQVMNEQGEIVDPDNMPEITEEDIRTLYTTMQKSRVIDEIALSLQRQGRMLTYAPNIGQEAAQVGSAFALRKTDWGVSAFRELGMWLIKGWPVEKILQYWYGNEWGSHMDEDNRLLPVSVPIASQYQHAVGIGMATRLREEDDVAMAYIGDGGTSQGDFHEALNFAGVYKTPTVFVIQNNQYAISVPRKMQTASENLAMKAIAYGIPGIYVDGNDVFAMLTASQKAVSYARETGPVLLEAYTYRMGAHTTSDDPTKYRTDDDVEPWKEKDPIPRLERYMLAEGLLKEDEIEPMIEKMKEEVMDAYRSIENSSDTELEDIFKYQYAEMTPQLTEQLEEYRAFLEGAESNGK
ncbi:MAG: pyruvate dehydrogenase (acetyl-transferring) E1 component subunit alpha [Peptoniphilaceae bacterium]|jgi:pyruvate dehydrogenase E1 component alpha subunit